MSKLRKLIFISSLWFINNIVSANQIEDEVKVSYIYNILQFVSFPENLLQENKAINVCVISNNSFLRIAKKINGEKTPQAAINIINKTTTSDFSHCNAIYVGNYNRDKVKSILDNLDTSNVLTIGERFDFLRSGGLIAFYIYKGTVRFRINRELLDRPKPKFKLSSRLIRLGL